MTVGALVPGVSVFTVTSRTVSSGLRHGVFATAGIVTGDILFILVALFGLSILVDALGDHYVLLKYLGGAYLVFLGVVLWRSQTRARDPDTPVESSLLASFLAGLLITLSDQKAILFYLGFFPAFLDLSQLTFLDTGIIILLATVTVGGTKLGYAMMADQARTLFQNPAALKRLNMAAGSVLLGAGIYLLIRA